MGHSKAPWESLNFIFLKCLPLSVFSAYNVETWICLIVERVVPSKGRLKSGGRYDLETSTLPFIRCGKNNKIIKDIVSYILKIILIHDSRQIVRQVSCHANASHFWIS